MLLARLRVTRAAYERIKTVLPAATGLPGGSEDERHREAAGPAAGEPPSCESTAPWSTDTAVVEASPRGDPTVAADDAVRSGTDYGSFEKHRGGEAPRNAGEGTGQTKTEDTGSPSAWQRGERRSPSCGEGAEESEAARTVCRSNGNGSSSGSSRSSSRSKAAASAERESRIVLWALRDAAARVLQEETRSYARRRRARSELGGRRQGTGETNTGNTPEEEGGGGGPESLAGGFNGGFPPAVEGLPWVIAARLPTAVSIGTITSSSTRTATATTARTGTARATTATASSAGRGTKWSSSGRGRTKQSHSSVSNQSPLTAMSAAASPGWRFPHDPGVGIDSPHDDGSYPTGPPSEEEGADGRRPEASRQGGEVGTGTASRSAVRLPLLPAEERKKR